MQRIKELTKIFHGKISLKKSKSEDGYRITYT